MKSKMEQKQSNFDENPSFFKIMFPIARISKQLSIPPEFHQHINKRAFNKAMFRDCSGRSWPVKLYENKRGIFLKNGWDRFYHDHSLGDFEVVTFAYDGEGCFDVIIFGKDGLEKLITRDDASNESSSFEHRSEEDENNSERDEVDDAPTHAEVVPISARRKRGRPRKNPLPNSQPPLLTHGKGRDVSPHQSSELKLFGVTKSSKKNMKVEIIESSDEDIDFRLQYIEYEKAYLSKHATNVRVKAFGTKPDVEKRKRGRPFGSKNKNRDQGFLCEEPEYSKKPEEEKGLITEIKKEIIYLCDEEPGFKTKKVNNFEEIYAQENKFRFKFPFFEICIGLEDINKKYMIDLPCAFVKKYLPKMTTEMVLINKKGLSWEVTFSNVANRFYGGWLQFMRDNELRHGDRCIFELVKEKEMKVYISRSEID